jgi:hypothetical protein
MRISNIIQFTSFSEIVAALKFHSSLYIFCQVIHLAYLNFLDGAFSFMDFLFNVLEFIRSSINDFFFNSRDFGFGVELSLTSYPGCSGLVSIS